MASTMIRMGLATMDAYGMNAVLAARGLRDQEREERGHMMAEAWAQEFSPHSLIVLLKADLALT